MRRKLLVLLNQLVAYPALLSISSAILLALSFSSYNLDMLVWFGFIPLFFAIADKNKSPKQIFFVSYICGVLFFLCSMYWFIFVTPAGWFMLSLYMALYFGAFGLLFNLSLSAYNLNPAAYFSIPSIWCILEYLRSHIGGGIGWNLLGYSQYKNTPIIQIADITGVYGVSFLILLVNLTLFLGIRMAINCQRAHRSFFVKSSIPFMDEAKAHPFYQTLTAFLIVLAALGYGYKKINLLDAALSCTKQKLKVSVLQGNIAQQWKWDSAYKDYIIEKYRVLTLEAVKESQHLIVWPETSAPGYLNDDEILLKEISALAKEAKTYLLVGAPMIAVAGTEISADYNSAVLFSPQGEISQQYNKLHLVPFGEFVPFERYIPFLRNILPLTGEFISGTEYTIFKLKTVKTTGQELQPGFGVLICFEDIFPDMARRFVKKGADFMINITNDAWFGKSCAAYQHTANSVLRAVENRCPFIRSANTGLSCFIDSAGRIYDRVDLKGKDLFVDGYRTQILAVGDSLQPAFYTRFGDAFILICSLIMGVFLVDYLRRHGYNK